MSSRQREEASVLLKDENNLFSLKGRHSAHFTEKTFCGWDGLDWMGWMGRDVITFWGAIF